MTHIKAKSALFLSLALSSCNVNVTGGDRLVEKLCDDIGKYTITEHPQVDGVIIEESHELRNYIGGDAAVLFEFTGLKYVEISTARPENLVKESIAELGYEEYKRLTSSPYLRIYFAKPDSLECINGKRPLLDSWLSEKLSSHNWCLAAKPIDKPTTKYRARAQSLETILGVSSVRFTITEEGKSEPISEAVNFYYTGGSGKSRGTSQCRGYGKYFKGKDFSTFGLIVETFNNQKSETYHFMKVQ